MSIECSNEELKKYNEEYLKRYLPKDQLKEGLQRLEKDEPVQYIVGNVDFYGLILNVDKRVLIPRFETEQLVEKTYKYLQNHFSKPSIIDLGTGSGCIALALKKLIPSSTITAIDISKDALDVARFNAHKIGVDIIFKQNNMLHGLTEKYDVIISNPPYIANDEPIMDIVKNNEPHQALYAANHGLYFYEDILKNCSQNLSDKFFIAFEIGEKQGEAIKKLAYKYLKNIEVIIEKDWNKLDRFVFIRGGIWN